MKISPGASFFHKFQINWGLQFLKIPSILRYLASYPEITCRLKGLCPLDTQALEKSQLAWLTLLSQLENPIERSFFRKCWVPIQNDGYDYFIDLSSEALPLFEAQYFFFEPYQWYKKQLIHDLPQFLLNLDQPGFSIDDYFDEADEKHLAEIQAFFREREALGLSGK